jgi:hypothetical protein
MRDRELLESTRAIVNGSRVNAHAAADSLLAAINDSLWDLRDRHHFDLHGRIFHARELVEHVLHSLEEVESRLSSMMVIAEFPPEGRFVHDSREAAQKDRRRKVGSAVRARHTRAARRRSS